MSIDWTTVIVAVTTLVGAAGTYAYQRRVDRQSTLIEKRREIYASYILAFQHNISGAHNNEEYQMALANAFLFGTDKVVRAISELHNQIADKAGAIDGSLATDAYVKMAIAMRADCFESSDLTASEMKKLVPFKY